MGHLAAISGRQAVKAFEKAGFEARQGKGSHVILKKPGVANLVIPLHHSVSPFLLRSQIRRAGLTEEEFLELLRWPDPISVCEGSPRMAIDPTTMTKLDELVAAIRGYDDPRRAADEWKQVYRLLQKAELPPGRVTGVVGMREVAGLTELIDQLRDPAAAAAPPDTGVPSAETCRRAMQAFRKRLAFTRLDDASRFSRHDPLSKGADSRVATAIVPPSEWPESVWQELVRQGKLRCTGYGLYEPTKRQPTSGRGRLEPHMSTDEPG